MKINSAAGVRRKKRGAILVRLLTLTRSGRSSANRGTLQLLTLNRASSLALGGATLRGTGEPAGAR
jgi:hypothetical protein